MAFNLQLDQALSGTAQAVTDENGTTSPLTLSTGRIGIGTTSPDAQLDVAGSEDSLVTVADTANGNRLLIGTDDQLPTFLRLRPQSGAGLAITNDGDKIGLFVRASDGHVGVGTTDPQAHLDVVGSGDSLVTVADTANGNSLLIGTDDQLPGFLRLRPQSGAGLAITNDGDRIGLFCSWIGWPCRRRNYGSTSTPACKRTHCCT